MPYQQPTLDIVKNDNYNFLYLTGLAKSMSTCNWYDVTVTATLLDGAGTITVITANQNSQYKIRDMKLTGGGTSFGAGGNRTIGLTDGTTTWTTLPNATIEAAPATTVVWGNAGIPFLTGTSNTSSVLGSDIYFAYNGGTTDHGGVGSIIISICIEQL